MTPEPRITILGVGNILLKDEGIGVRAVERLCERFDFPDNVSLVDGGVLGVRLMGVIADTQILIILDAVRNQGAPGDLYRLEGDEVPRRVLAKQSMHDLDLPEVLALCSAIDQSPREIVVLGMEPEDMTTLDVNLTDTAAARLDDLVALALKELDRLGVAYTRR